MGERCPIMHAPPRARFGFAYGEGDRPNRFIGDALFGLARYKTNFTGAGVGQWTDFFFQWQVGVHTAPSLGATALC